MLLAQVYTAPVLAQSAVPEVDLSVWLQWGVLGLVVIAIIVTKQLVPGWIYQDLKEENVAVRTENKELVERLLDLQETALPALKESNSVVAEAMRELRALREQYPAQESRPS